MPRYRLRQKILSFGEDFTIENDAGNRAFEVDGKLLTVRETFDIKDATGEVVATVRGRLVSIRAKMDVLRDGDVIATITKALFAPLRDRFSVEVAGGQDLDVSGSILDHEYTVRREDTVVAQISKRWFTIADTYGVDIRDGEDDALILAIAVALDEMAHDPDEGRG